MTKLKSKKMTKSTFAVIIMAIAMIAMIAFGGTYAYFTATATPSSADAKTATIQLTAGSNVVTTHNFIVPGDEILGAVTYNATGTTAKSIAIVEFEATGFSATINTAKWTKLGETNYYYQVIEVTEDTSGSEVTASVAASFDGTFIANAVTYEAEADYDQAGSKPAEMGVDISVSIAARAIQYRGLTLEDDTISTDSSDAADVAAAAVEVLFPAA